MTLSINNNASSLVALASLNATQSELSQAQSMVSTGKKVGSASDSPAIYSIAASMNGDISGLSAVSDSLSMGSQIVATATGATSSIISTLQTLQNTVTAAGQTGIDTTTMETQVANAINDLNAFARSATFNGVNLLTSTGDSGATNGTANIVTDIKGNTLNVANQIGASTTLSDFLGLTAGLGAGNSAGATTQQVLNSSATGASITLAKGAGATAAFAAGNTFTVTNGNGDKTVFEFNNGGALTTSPSATQKVVAVVVNPATDSMSSMLGALSNAMNENGYNAVLDTSTGNLNVTGQGLTGIVASDGTDFSTANLNSAQSAITTVTAALTKMESISQTLGSDTNRISGLSSYTSTLSNNLTNGVSSLTDADMAAASAKLTSLQTKQQLAIKSLTIANSQSQNILSLFQ